MIKYIAADLISMRIGISRVREAMQGDLPSKEATWDITLAALQRSVRSLSEKAQVLELIETIGRCSLFDHSLGLALTKIPLSRTSSFAMDKFTPEEITREIDGILHTLDRELKHKYFAFIPSNRVDFFEQDRLFEDEVYNKFEDARQDIKSAGNCLAADLNTAAVFHLMRVVECGMRTLAKHVKPRFKLPLEYCDWSSLIRPMEKKLTRAEGKRRGLKKSKQIDFYSRCLSDCKSFIETRNRVSHAREPFSDKEARAVLERVKTFMQQLVKL